MYPIVVLVAALLLVAVRGCITTREQQEKLHRWGMPWVLLCQPYFMFLCMLLMYGCYQVYSFIELAASYKGLTSSTFHRPYASSDEEKAQLATFDLPGWLAGLSIASPCFIAVTLVITFYHTKLHVPPAEELRWFPTYSHDLAMQVVNLPLVYGLFALDNIVSVLTVFTGRAYARGLPDGTPQGEQFGQWLAAAAIGDQEYDTNYELADLYEARALHCFGLLCFALVHRQVLREAPTVKHVITTVEEHVRHVCDGSGDLDLLQDLVLLKDPANLLYAPLRQTSNLGVMVFVWTYFLKSMYSLVLTGLAEAPFNIELCGKAGRFPAACSLKPYAEGAAMLASTLAIMNIFVFEHNLSEFLNTQNGFRPVMKFLAVKVLVSIVFFQYYILDFLGKLISMTEPQTKLCYSCLICLEVLPLSLLVLYSWSPREGDWHSHDRYLRSGGDGGAEFAGAVVGEYMAGDSFAETQKPKACVQTGSRNMNELAAYVELRGMVTDQDGHVIEDMIHTLSRDMKSNQRRIFATFKNAVVCGREFVMRPKTRASVSSPSLLGTPSLATLETPLTGASTPSPSAAALPRPPSSARSSASTRASAAGASAPGGLGGLGGLGGEATPSSVCDGI